jgi:hypothetical protein
VRFEPAVVEQVLDRAIAAEHHHVGDDPAMAPPPHRFAAHHRGAAIVRVGQHLVERVDEGRLSRPTGVAAKRFVAPRDVRRVGRRLAEAAEAWLPSVRDAGLRQPRLELGPGDMRMTAAPGRGAYVDDALDCRAAQQSDEFVLAQGPVPEGHEGRVDGRGHGRRVTRCVRFSPSGVG